LQVLQASLDDAESLVPLVALPDGYSFKDLESFMPTRTRFRGKMETSDIDSFELYVTRHADADSACFVNRDAMSAKVFLDMGGKNKPLHCAHTCYLSLMKSPEYKAVGHVHGDRFSQKDFAEWLEDWQGNIQVVGKGGDDIALGMAVAAVRRLKIEQHTTSGHEVQATRSSRSVLEEVEATSDTGLPEAIKFTCKAYDCLKERTFVLRISVITSHEKPEFSLRVLAFDTHKDAMAHEFADLVEARLAESMIVPILGSFNA